MSKYLVLLTVIFSLTVIPFVTGASTPAAASTSGSQNLGEIPDGDPGNVSIEAGNITLANIYTNVSTLRWAGLLGNVSGNILLGDANGSVLYQWIAEGNLVYVADSGSITWASLTDSNATGIIADYSFLGGDYVDNYSLTFNESSESIGSQIFSTLQSDYAMTLDNSGSRLWKTYSLTDTTTSVFVGKVRQDQTSYKGTTVDFQMIIPEDGTAGDTDATDFYLWLELI